MEFDKFTKGYIVCMLWAENDNSRSDGGDPLEDNYDESDLADEAVERIVADCRDFQQANAELLRQYVEMGRPLEYAGHDFWLTRNGHGTGFWDRGFGEVGRALTTAAEAYGACSAIVGDDGKLYVE